MKTEPKIIFEAIYKALSVTEHEIKSHRRKRDFSDARAIFSYIMFKNGAEPKNIALFVNRDRTSVYHFIKIAKFLVENNQVFTAKIKKVYKELENELE